MRVLMSGKGKPYAACSSSFQPVPSPSSTRPPEMWSAVTASFASMDGWRKVAGETSVPSRSADVTAARPQIVPHASRAAPSRAPPSVM